MSSVSVSWCQTDSWKWYSGLGYALVLFVLGMPMWWFTTSVTRVQLPYSTIQDLDQLDMALRVSVVLISNSDQQQHLFGPKLQSLLQDSAVYQFHLSSRAMTSAEQQVLDRATSIQELDELLAELHSQMLPGTIQVFEVPNLFKLSGDQNAVVNVGRHRCVFYQAHEPGQGILMATDVSSAIREVMLSETSVLNLVDGMRWPQQVAKSKWTLRRMISVPHYNLLFTLMVPQPERLDAEWQIESAIEQYLEPLLNDLKDIFSFSIQSQILYLASLAISPKSQTGPEDRLVMVVNSDDLGVAIDMESQLTSYSSSDPSLNFITYIPPSIQAPLHLVDHDHQLVASNAFIVPRWGGVLIQNNVTVDERAMMSVFLAQLRILLGLQLGSHPNQRIQHIPWDSLSGLKTWEKDFLARLCTLESLQSAKLSLQSLTHLLYNIRNIVISEEIGQQVQNSVSNFLAAVRLAQEGLLMEAFRLARASHLAAEKAFFDNSLLELLYFPENQKFAIYVPLFLPIAFSLLDTFLPMVKKHLLMVLLIIAAASFLGSYTGYIY